MMVNFTLTKKNKDFFIKCFYGLLSFSAIAGCKKGDNGAQDFSHSVTITGAVCTGSNVTLSLQNNADYTAILAAHYPAAMPERGDDVTDYEFSGLQCDTTIFPTFENDVTITLPPLGNGTAILYCGGTGYCPSGSVITCEINPFSKGVGWYNISNQQITCL